MSVDRLVPNSSTPGLVQGDVYMDAVSEEIEALWNYCRTPLTNVAGSANAITSDVDPPLTGALVDGMSFLLRPLSLNTAGATLQLGTLSAISLANFKGDLLNGGELIPGVQREVIFNGTSGYLEVSTDLPNGQLTIATDANATLTVGSTAPFVKHTGTLTADRTLTLSTTGASSGDWFEITRTGTGAFNLIIGSALKNLAVNTWCRVAFDGAAWYLSAYGAL